jgi:hypothetical protein
MRFERQKMVGWFDFEQLINTGLKTVISTTLGNYADRREIEAALSPDYTFYDLSEKFDEHNENKDEIWVDYISDLGDGFNSTYTMAHLLGKMTLKVGKEQLKQGDILIMGGDEVYPTPEIEQYNNRLKGPYKAAFPDPDDENYWLPKDKISLKRQKRAVKEPLDPLQRPPFLFAIPGNHDWYDGLSNFIKIFTQQRRFGNWQTLQKRSYFAIKLKHDCWIWGTDVQLDSDIDQPQKLYFKHIGSIMPNNSKIIMCTAEPAWVYRSIVPKNTSYTRLDYFIKNYIDNDNGWLEPETDEKTGKKTVKSHQLIATLTGDLHHYAHYCETDKNGHQFNHMFTAGGGGAFLHPTHNLPKELTGLINENPVLQNCYPDVKTSKWLSYQNFLFPIINKQFFAFMGVFYVLFAWLLWKVKPGVTTIGLISKHESLKLEYFVNSIPIFSSILIFVLAFLLFGFYKFTDTGSTKNKFVWLFGVFHGLVHIVGLFVMSWLLARYNMNFDPSKNDPIVLSFVFIIQLFVFGGLCGAFIMGLYLFFSNHFFNIHVTESFSGLAIEGYKNFIRIKFEKDKITVFPLAVDSIVKNWKNYNTDDFPMFKIGQPSKFLRRLYLWADNKKLPFLRKFLDFSGYHDGTKPKVHIVGGEGIVIFQKV